ncbi:MAG: TolC family protein, partial [Mariprofundaceae bacterium]
MKVKYLPVILLASCATYHPQALDTSARLSASLQDLQLDMDASKYPELPEKWQIKKVAPDDGLNEVETIVLAVLNSPQLKASRTRLEESRAALYAAGLLSDPQFSTSLDFPKSKAGLDTGESFALGIDLQQILTRGARRDVATGMAKATYLNVLWREWQIIQQARMLWRRALIQRQQQTILQDQFEQAKATWQGQHDALSQGNTTVDQEGLSLAPAMDAQAAFIESKRQINATLHDLNLLLGVDPTVKLVLTEPEEGVATLIATPLAPEHLQPMLASIGDRRPDLLALQAGYKSQESKVREQILSQFPSFSIGANSLRDTSGVWTLGPFINL